MPSSRSRADARRRVLTWCRFLPLLRHFNPRGRGAHSPLKLRFVSWGRLFRISGCFISVLLGGAFPELGKKAADARGVHRSEERRVGKECVGTCRSRWSP